MNTQKSSPPKTHQIDLRIDATPIQVASALVRGGAPRRVESKQSDKAKA